MNNHYLNRLKVHEYYESQAVTNGLEFGGAPMSQAIARKTMHLRSRSAYQQKATINNSLPRIITEREQEILQHLINGWDAWRSATELNLSVLTVRKHIANIYGKLHVSSKAQVISLAHKNKWV